MERTHSNLICGFVSLMSFKFCNSFMHFNTGSWSGDVDIVLLQNVYTFWRVNKVIKLSDTVDYHVLI